MHTTAQQKVLRQTLGPFRSVATMRTRELDWSKLDAPKTPKQQISYTTACQNFFVETPSQPVSLRTGAIEVEGKGRIEPARLFMMHNLILPSEYSFRCAVCDVDSEGHDAALMMTNPYSRWAILRCRACSDE